MKTYVLTVSRIFPKTHKRAGDETYFPVEILNKNKIHTIRSNYPFWAKRIKEIQEGKAILSIRYWSGKPYKSKQIEFCKLDKDSGIGIQKLEFHRLDLEFPSTDGWQGGHLNHDNLSKNDGLSVEDFKEWFKKYDLSKPMAIIHFTDFRY
jgi:hypothetical protein